MFYKLKVNRNKESNSVPGEQNMCLWWAGTWKRKHFVGRALSQGIIG